MKWMDERVVDTSESRDDDQTFEKNPTSKVIRIQAVICDKNRIRYAVIQIHISSPDVSFPRVS